LVDPRDPTAAAKTILNLLDFPDRAQLVERARKNSRRFDWALAAEKTRCLYARLAG
jgi:hypothetical protein